MPRARVAVFVSVGLALSAAARAQSLSELLPRLLSESVTMPSTTGTVAGNPHEAHFLPAVAQLKAPYALNSALVTQLATFPLGSSSGGFTYTTNEGTGIPERNSNNFGPTFAERALTNGKGRFSVGANFQHVEFEEFEGQGLSGDVRFYLQHNDCCPGQSATTGAPPATTTGPSGPDDKNLFFEGDLVRADLTLKARTDTVSFFANYGITNRLDLGIAVPIVRVDLDASMASNIIRLATQAKPEIHSFQGTSPDQRTVSESGSSSGLGDVVIRGKWNVMYAPGGGIALGADLRLPTGNEKELRGTGATQAKASFYYSGEFGKLAPHVNVGYTFSSGSMDPSVGTYALGDDRVTPTAVASAYDTIFRGETPVSTLTEDDLRIPDEINYTIGAVLAVHPKFTLNADFIGRTLRKVNRFLVAPQVFNFRAEAPPASPAPLQSATYTDGLVLAGQGDLQLLLGVVGVKINVTRTLLLNASVLFPLSSDGLRPKETLVIGLDYAF